MAFKIKRTERVTNREALNRSKEKRELRRCIKVKRDKTMMKHLHCHDSLTKRGIKGQFGRGKGSRRST